MARLSQDIIDRLNSIPLTKVMESAGYSIARLTRKEAFYLCPFHGETEPSFKVDLRSSRDADGSGTALAGFYCYGCGKKGYGAIMLQAELMGISLSSGFRDVAASLSEIEKESGAGDVINALAKSENMIVAGDWKNSFYHRARPCAQAHDQIEIEEKVAFSHADLRALGCQVEQVFRKTRASDGSLVREAVLDDVGKPVYRYSFERGFYDRSGKVPENLFDPEEITRVFGCRPLRRFITEKRWNEKKQQWQSYEVEATDQYPVFCFMYSDSKGWWLRKYEPYFRQVRDADGNLSPSYKFTWWYERGVKRDDELSGRLYGDLDAVNALYGDEVVTTSEGHPLVEVSYRQDDKYRTVRKFKRLVICSGPRDAMSVYFHSDAHVVYPHSESANIPLRLIHRMLEIANEVFVLFDADKTGVRMAHRLCMRCLELKMVYLPQQLAGITSPRTGRPCKDAEEYFNYYPSVLDSQGDFRDGNINDHFDTLLHNAKSMKFWQRKGTQHRDEDGEKYVTFKYTLDIDSMKQFVAAQGFLRYRQGDSSRFVMVGQDNIVDIVPDSEAVTQAKKLLKDYLKGSRRYYDPDLSNAISDTRRLSSSTINEIPQAQIDFHSWGEDFDYFFFRNTAVLITPEEIRCVPYEQLPFQVNREAIMPHDFRLDTRRLFRIEPNPDVENEKEKHRQRLLLCSTLDERKAENADWAEYLKLWKYKLIVERDMDEMPPVFQFIYDLSRILWRKEEDGYELSPEERQFQDMHFINKAGALGYALSRFRTSTRQQMVTITDYSVMNEGKSYGRNGKSLLLSLVGCVRRGIEVQGQTMKTSPDTMGRNFTEFVQTVHSHVIVEDLRRGTSPELFYNSTSRISVKNLYRDEVLIPKEESPKLLISMNEPFDLDAPSTLGRMYPMLASNYYHEESMQGEVERRTPETKFGYDIIDKATPEDFQFTLNMLAQFLQFYLKTKEVIRPPYDQKGYMRQLYVSIKDPDFIRWANGYFADPFHFERPIDVREMAISFMDDQGLVVSEDAINGLLPKFRRNLRNYCGQMKIDINPDVVYSGNSDRAQGVRRCITWVTVFEHGRPKEPRTRVRAMGRCLYFYKWGAAPKEHSHVLEAPATDPELRMD